MPPEALSTRAAIFGSTFEMTPSTHSASASTSRPKMMVGILEIHLLTHDLIRKPVPIPDQVRDMLFRDHARSCASSLRAPSERRADKSASALLPPAAYAATARSNSPSWCAAPVSKRQ